MSSLVVVGTSAAGVAAAAGAREAGFTGRISLVGEEPHRPYERPPLSKSLLTDDDPGPKALLSVARLESLDLELLLGVRATALDPVTREVHTTAGSRGAEAGVVLATGVRARRLDVPGADGPGVLQLRTLDDATLLTSGLSDLARRNVPLVVIGAGFIGLEVAAAARSRGVEVTVLEAASAALLRGGGAAVGEWFVARHREHGVAVRTSVRIAGIERDSNGAPSGVRLDDGSIVAAGLVVVGVGVVPRIELADTIGIATRDGILVDSCGRSSNPWVYAAGDVAHHADAGRIEHWTVASEQGRSAGHSIVGADLPWTSVPYFWSEQFGSTLQIFGRPHLGDELVVRDDDGTSVCWVWLRDGRVSAAGGVDRPRDARAGRDLVRTGARPDPEALRDTAIPLNAHIPRATGKPTATVGAD